MQRDSFTQHDDIAPSVIGPGFISEADGEEPELAFVPSERANRGDTEVTLEFRRTNDDRLAVLAYTSLDALVAGCGERQPWVSMPVTSVQEVVERSGADVVLWDPALPPEQRRDAPAEEGE